MKFRILNENLFNYSQEEIDQMCKKIDEYNSVCEKERKIMNRYGEYEPLTIQELEKRVEMLNEIGIKIKAPNFKPTNEKDWLDEILEKAKKDLASAPERKDCLDKRTAAYLMVTLNSGNESFKEMLEEEGEFEYYYNIGKSISNKDIQYYYKLDQMLDSDDEPINLN